MICIVTSYEIAHLSPERYDRIPMMTTNLVAVRGSYCALKQVWLCQLAPAASIIHLKVPNSQRFFVFTSCEEGLMILKVKQRNRGAFFWYEFPSMWQDFKLDHGVATVDTTKPS